MILFSFKKSVLFLLLSGFCFGTSWGPLFAEEPLNPQTTAVRYVFTPSVERRLYPWLQEEVADTWFDGEIPKICHICDNVYRYPTDNGSMVTRGVQNMSNRKRLATILEVQNFLTVIIRQVGETLRIETALQNLKQEEPLSAKTYEWSKPWW